MDLPELWPVVFVDLWVKYHPIVGHHSSKVLLLPLRPPAHTYGVPLTGNSDLHIAVLWGSEKLRFVQQLFIMYTIDTIKHGRQICTKFEHYIYPSATIVMIRKLHTHYLNLCICKMMSGTPTCTSLLLSKFCLPLFLLSLMLSFLLLLKVLLWDNKKGF